MPARLKALGMAAGLFLAALSFPCALHGQDSAEKRLVRAGIELFASFIAADMDILSKVSRDDKVTVLFIYQNDRMTSDEMASYLVNKIKTIRGKPVEAIVISLNSTGDYANMQLAGIFISQRLEENEVKSLIAFGRQHKAILFSPFQQDVEQGVPCGMYVGSRILPYVNLQAMKASSIHLKSFFLEIAKTYDQ